MAFNTDEHILNSILADIDDHLSRIGIVYRIFGRVKTKNSITKKIYDKAEEYRQKNKKMQDLFGVRIALYFSDDVQISQELVKSIYKFDSKSVDPPTKDIFGPTRCNVIYSLPEKLISQCYYIKTNDLIDSTVEVQYRSILSEGWHEVEHDLRYKCKSDWNDHHDLSRSLNGIMATLETCDWSMIKMFDELAYRHYKAGVWESMIRNKYRLRFQDMPLSEDIKRVFSSVDGLAKAIYRTDRSQFLQKLAFQKLSIPITPANIVFLVNRLFIDNNELRNLEPEILKDLLDDRLVI